jgi:hypothetical protein
MPLKLHAGVSKKMGLPNYGSLGASCHVEVDLDGSLLGEEVDMFHQHVRDTFVACRQAVNDELARHQAASAAASTNGPTQQSDQPERQHDGDAAAVPTHEGNGANGQRATSRQIDYVCVLARQIRGLGIRRLDSLSDTSFGKPITELSSEEASQLITALKDVRAGKVDLVAVLEGRAA